MSDGPLHTVLVPGLLCSARLYERVLPVVWAHGAVTIADTRRGTTIGELAEQLLAAAPERFVLVGLSMGGYVALEVVRRSPERIRALALVSTSARPDTPEQTSARRTQMTMAREDRFDELVETVFPVLVDAAARGDEELHSIWEAMAHSVGPEAFCAQQNATISRPDARPILPTITAPTAVIHGVNDGLIGVEHGEELAAAIPGARLTTIERCGHMSALERPSAVATAIDALLRSAS